MSAAATIQEFIYRGGNVFFGVQDASSQEEYRYEESFASTQPQNRLEQSIVRTDRALLRMFEWFIQILQSLFARRQLAVVGAGTGTSSAYTTTAHRTQAFSSSKRLVQKFNQQYKEVQQKAVPQKAKKSLGELMELALGITMYGIYRLVKMMSFRS